MHPVPSRSPGSSKRRRVLRPASLVLFLACAPIQSCSRLDAAPPDHLELRLVRPANPDGLFLNEDLVFYFSRDLDRASVTRESVRIRSSDGRDARGELEVDGDRIRFVPAPVTAFDLADGGYLPGQEYTVTLAGFPRPDGLRSDHGHTLARTYVWRFRTVGVSEPRSGWIFDDRMQDRSAVLRLFPSPSQGQGSTYQIGIHDSIYLACDKPLDPSTIHDEDFELIASAPSSARVSLRARLIENHETVAPRPRVHGVKSSASAEQWDRERRACVLELLPKQALVPGDYRLRIVRGFHARDFGGRAVWDGSRLPFTVRASARGVAESTPGTLHETFLDTRFRSPVAIRGFDGTAHWSDTGRVEVRYPLAAGSGRDAHVTLDSTEPRADVQAVRLSLEAGRRSELSANKGLVVLRCQGRMAIQGSLVRNAPAVEPMTFEPHASLSSWLERAQRSDPSWTVLIAGGDLVIDGELRVTTPLLLCAGGIIRVAGSVRAPEGQLYFLREGGGLDIDPAASVAPLTIDPPEARSNPLVERLRYAVLSSVVPSSGGVARWIGAEARGYPSAGSRAIGGRWSVTYVPEANVPGAGLDELVPVDSPRGMDHPTPLQFLIQLEVEPGPTWDPPFVDCVQLSWEDEATGLRAGGDGR